MVCCETFGNLFINDIIIKTKEEEELREQEQEVQEEGETDREEKDGGKIKIK